MYVSVTLERKHMQNAIAKAFEVSITVSVALKDFDFVVTAFGESVGKGSVKGVENALRPVQICVCALHKLWNVRVLRH